mgnify:CR=1 FL=1
MKKHVLLFVVMLPFLVFSQNQPVISINGQTTNKHFDVSSGSRSVPPGTLLWSQPPYCENAFASQLAPNYPFDAKLADDFLFPVAPAQISAIRWWQIWFNGGYAAPSSFNVFIYNDNSCLPGTLVNSWNIPFLSSNEDAGCSVSFESREYWASLNPAFVPASNQHYWIVIQPVLDFPPQTMLMESTVDNLCSAAMIFPEIGLYGWEAIDTDIAFEMYGVMSPPLETPVSSWALVLGGVLIAGAVFMRYRRIS